MKILILHHRPLYRTDKSVSGEHLRVRQLQRGLSAHHDVAVLCASEKSSLECRQHIRAWAADCVIVMHAHLLHGLLDLNTLLILDLYAQRMMEALFEDQLLAEVMEHLCVFRQCAMFLVSNRRQRWSWQGVLTLLGAQLRPESIMVVPLAAQIEEDKEIPAELTLIGGGVCWPWQNPWSAMKRALSHLERREVGRIIWMGAGEIGIQHPRLFLRPWGSYTDFRAQLTRATAAFDWMEHNVEREYAIAFRHMDYVGCGLPILTGSYSPLRDLGQGFYCANDDIEAVLDRCIDEPDWLSEMRRACYTFAVSHSIEQITQELNQRLNDITPLGWVSSPLIQPTLLWAQLREAEQGLLKLEQQKTFLETDLQKKSLEIERQNDQIAQQGGSIVQLSSTIESIVSYRKEVVQVLGQQVQQHSHSEHILSKENAILRADIEKKSAELAAMDQLVLRLENDIQSLREQLERKRRFLRRK